MQINRLFEIVYIMLDKQHTTAKQLALHFEVSVRTIYRDIDILSGAGIPIYTTQGTGGGIFIYDGYKFNTSILSKEERNQIILGLKSVMSTQEIASSPLLTKLNGVFKNQNVDWIEIDFSRWGNKKHDQEKFSILREAITTYHTIEIVYVSSKGQTTTRKVSPIKLIYKSKSWYLQGYDHLRNDYRTFKSNRILTITLLLESFEPHKLPLIPDIEQVAMISPALINITLKCAKHLGYRLFDEFENESIKLSPEGIYTVTTDMPNDPWVISYLLSFGHGLEVIEPVAIREALVEEIKKIQQFYQ